MHRIVTCTAVLAVLSLLPPTLQAQEAEPLQKSDVIRLLTGTTYTRAEVAGIVRQSCLSFTPTERDRSDFRALGADDSVMAAIDGCGQTPMATPALQLTMERRIFDVTAGDTIRVLATVNRGSAGESGLRLRPQRQRRAPRGIGRGGGHGRERSGHVRRSCRDPCRELQFDGGWRRVVGRLESRHGQGRSGGASHGDGQPRSGGPVCG